MEFNFIRDLKVGVKNVTLAFIVLDIGRPTATKEGLEVRTCKIADRTGCILFSAWNEIGAYLQPGDICRLTKGYVSLFRDIPTLSIAKGGELVKTGEFSFVFNESCNMSDPNQNQLAQGISTTNANKVELENSAYITKSD